MSLGKAMKEWTDVKVKEYEEHRKFIKTVMDRACICVFCGTEFYLSGARSQYWALIYEGKCPHCGAFIETQRANIEIPKKEE